MATDTVLDTRDVIDFHDTIDVRVARSKEEIQKAYSLVYREYLKRGYTSENQSFMRFSLYNALPQATTFIALTKEEEVVITATVLLDSPLGLPMDKNYRDELNELRGEEKGICEITMLASDSFFFKHIHPGSHFHKLFFLFSFFKMLLDFSRDFLNQKFICIAIHPKYKAIFEHLLFLNLGGLKSYHDVNGAPAIAKYLDMYSVEEGFSPPGKERLHKIFVEERTDTSKFMQKFVFQEEDLRYFFIEKNDIFQNIPSSVHLQYLKTCYPQYNCFDEFLKK